MKKEKLFLIMEFGTNSVKIVKAKRIGDQFQLLEAARKKIEPEAEPQHKEKLFQEITGQLLSGRNLGAYTLLLSINSIHTCFSSFVIPRLSRKEIAETLKWKIKDEIPFPLEEAVIDFQLFETEEGGTPQYLALVAATPREAVHSQLRFLPQLKSKSFSYATVCFSINAFASSLTTEETVMILDIGNVVTEISVYSKGQLSFLRKIAFGRQSLVDAMRQSIVSDRGSVALTVDEAEAVIQTENLFDQNSKSLVAGKIELTRLYPLVRPEFEKFSNEINRSLDYFVQQHGGTILHIYVTGGLSNLKGLVPFLSQSLQISVEVLNPAKVIPMSSNIQENLHPFYRLMSLILDRQETKSDLIQKIENSLERPLTFMTFTKAVFAIAAIWVLVFGALIWRYQNINHKAKQIQFEVSNLATGYEESKKIEDRLAQLNRAKAAAALILSKEPSWLDLFLELSNVFQDDVILNSLTFDHQIVMIDGDIKSDNENAVSDFLLSLEGPIFKNVTLVNVEKKEDASNFTVRAEVN